MSLLRSHTVMFQLLTEGTLNEEMLSIAERHYQRLQEDMILFLHGILPAARMPPRFHLRHRLGFIKGTVAKIVMR